MLKETPIFIWLFNNLFFIASFTYIEVAIFVSLFKIEANLRDRGKACILATILTLLPYLFIVSPYIKILNMLTTIIIFRIVFKSSIEKCILGSVFNAMTNICPEILFAKILCSCFEGMTNYITAFYNLKYSFCLMFLIAIFRILVLVVIKYKKVVIRIKENLSFENKWTIIVVSMISIILIFINLIQIEILSYNIFLINIFTLIIYFVISVKSIIKIEILEEEYKKIHNIESYNKNLSVMYDDIRSFKHNFSNFVQALDGYVKTNNIAGIRSMNKGILKEYISTKNLEFLNPKIINNSAIYNIITNKYYLAQEENILMNIEVMIDLKEIKISNYELCKILAILLDNAIEAASKCKGEKLINLKMLKDKKVNRKLIIVENSYINTNIDIDKIFEKGYSTKSGEDKESHGLGLWNVKKILVHNKNLNLFTHKGNLFVQQLEIYE